MASVVGQRIQRVEDQRFITGAGTYTDDITRPGQAYLTYQRSPYAHAEIRSIDIEEAKNAPGVLGVFTGEDLDGVGCLKCVVVLPNADGTESQNVDRPLLARGRVRNVGETVVAVVAETAAQARDAADLVIVDYEELPALGDIAAASAPGAVQIWDHAPDNKVIEFEAGDAAAAEAAFGKADHVTKLRLRQNRISATPMEARGAVGEYDAENDHYTLWTGTQGSIGVRDQLAGLVFQIPNEKLRVVTPDMGGGFGMRMAPLPEQGLVLWAAKQVGRPVKWISERGEGFQSDSHGRDVITDAELALDKDGRILGLRLDSKFNLGAYLTAISPIIQTRAPMRILGGVYDIPAIYNHVTGYFSNTVPVDAYRGAGRPEAIYMIERLIDTAARELGLEPDEIRRRNFFEIGEEPHVTFMGTPFDSGDFKDTLARGLAQADWDGFPAREAESHRRGKLRGRGVSYYCELTLGNPLEAGQIRFTENERVEMVVGTLSHGQGHATTFAQIVADRLGIGVDRIDLVQGDTDIVKSGGGTGGSRSTQMGGNALMMAADASVEKGKQLAAEMLEAAAADIEYGEGKFTVVGTDRSVGLFEVAKRAQDKSNLPEHLREALADGLNSDETYNMQESTFPNGCHVCEVEIDPETGQVSLAGYSVVDDFGRVINPMIVEGQVHGGVAQGIGQALLEEIVYESDTGQLLTGSFMDYCMPRAEDMPDMKFSLNEILCKTNPLGIKGCGEAGTVGAMPSTMNAVVDALFREYGIKHIDMPATPLRVWEAIRAAGGAKRAAE